MLSSDAIINTALSAAQNGSGAVTALYCRVLSFGKTSQGAGAIASEDLMAWVGAQKSVATTPEIQAWLLAQRELQSLRKAGTMVTAATASTTAARASRRAASRVATAGGITEEGIMAAAVGTTVGKVIESTGTEDDEIIDQETTPGSDVNYENAQPLVENMIEGATGIECDD
mmetsp:Transcript_28134/g.67766  ORF Transcript_28134/g.67766 Transcript_28134/m.67766 type:complete len:172 (+) Transcript_28134:289-804(+)